MLFQIVLKFLAGFANDEVDRWVLAAFNPAEPPRSRQNQLLQHIIHVADLMGEQRCLVALNAEFNGAFDIDVEAVQRQKADGVIAAQYEALALQSDFHHVVNIGIKVVDAGIEGPRHHAFQTVTH